MGWLVVSPGCVVVHCFACRTSCFVGLFGEWVGWFFHLAVFAVGCVCKGEPVFYLVECCFTSTETEGLLGTGAQDVHLDFHTAPELCAFYC